MPTYIALVYTPDVDWTRPEHAEETKQYAAFGEEAEAVIKGGQVLYPTGTAKTVRVDGGKGGKMITHHGPYADTDDALTGFYLLECADLDEAVEVAASIPAAWNGAVEVRPVLR